MGKQKKFGLQGYNSLVSNIKNYYEISYTKAREKYKEIRNIGLEIGLDKATAINRANYIVSAKASGNVFKGETVKEQLIRSRFEAFASKYGLEEQLDAYARGDIDYNSFIYLIEKTKIDNAKFVEKYAKGD